VTELRKLRWAGHVACMVERRRYTGFWWGNLRERDILEDPGIHGEDNIKMDLQKEGFGGMDWIKLAQDRWQALVNAVMNLQVP